MYEQLTLDQVKQLAHGDILYSLVSYNSKGQPHRARITSKIQTWKRNPNKIRVAWKHGLYVYGEITETNLDQWTLDEQYALDQRKD